MSHASGREKLVHSLEDVYMFIIVGILVGAGLALGWSAIRWLDWQLQLAWRCT